MQSLCKQSKGCLTLEKFQNCMYLTEPFIPQFWFRPANKGSSLHWCDGIKFPGSSVPLIASHSTGKKDATNRNLLWQKIYCLLIRKTMIRENGANSMTFQHLMWRDSSWFVACPSPHYYTPRMGVTRSEFTLAPAYKACLLVRHSGGQRHLIMAIARGMHGSSQWLLAACTRLLRAWHYTAVYIKMKM